MTVRIAKFIADTGAASRRTAEDLSLIHISEPTRLID